MLRLAWQLSKDSLELLWWAVVAHAGETLLQKREEVGGLAGLTQFCPLFQHLLSERLRLSA